VNIFDRALARAETRKPLRGKSFSMPPFWSVDGSKVALDLATMGPYQESAGAGFEDYVQSVYKKNGIVFACIMARARVFSQARFLYQQMVDGRPGDLFGNNDLRIVERPWDNGTTGALLTVAEIDASVSGNFFATLADSEGNIGASANRNDPELFIARLRPDWSTLIIASPNEDPYSPAARVVGLSYKTPGGGDSLILHRKEFMHYAPLPDPVARWRGMSWLSTILRDAQADSAYTTHTLAFLKNGATPNLVVSLPEDIDPKEFQKFVKKFKTEYEGAANAYRTLFVAGGADVKPVSAEFQQLDVAGSQGKLETRIAAAAGVHPTIAGLSEGLAGSSLNSGNFGAARRLMVDSTIRDLWGKFASSVEKLAPPRDKMGNPTRGSVRMWYDARDIPFLREDAGDEAKTFFTQIQAARHAVDGGWDADAAIDAAAAADIRLLKGKHSGMLSVQLRPPGAEDTSLNTMGVGSVPTLNGINGNGRAITSASR
jgi:phage portal protein BeeE